MRRSTFPELIEAYRRWADGDSLRVLEEAVHKGREHWLETAHKLVKCYRDAPDNCANKIIESVPVACNV